MLLILLLTHFYSPKPIQPLIPLQRKQLAVLAGKKEIEDMLLYQAAKDAELMKREEEEVHNHPPKTHLSTHSVYDQHSL